jgi:uncharacterized RDD family membrane protein YckC
MLHRKKCLALTPTKPRKEHLELFKGIAQEFGFDLLHSSNRRERVDSILQASFLIADVSGNDLGVLYDVGVAHTFGKQVFLVTDSLDALAFDMAGNRTWVIDPSSENREIYQAMERFLGTRQTIGPVRLFLGKYAFFGENLIVQRLGAFLIDILLIVLLLAVVLLLFYTPDQNTIKDKIEFLMIQFQTIGEEGMKWVENLLIVWVYVLALYLVLLTWILGATVGQLVTGIRVVQADYRRATFGQCVGRTALTVLVIWTFGAAFLAAIVRPGYRAAHDILSGTIVVRRHPR